MRQPAFARRRFVGPGLAAVLGTVLLMAVGCDPAVTILEPSEKYQFSLFGTLDVAADTQVIRVEPLGDTTRIGAPEGLDATVVLENLDEDTEVALKDSFESVSGGVARVHNFRTSHSIQPGTTYRVAVRVDGEAVTTATTTTPAQAPTLRHEPDTTDDRPFLLPCSLNARDEPVKAENTFTFRARDLESVAAVRVTYPVELPDESSEALKRFDHYDDVTYSEALERYRISVFYGKDLIKIIGQRQGCPSRSKFNRSYAVTEVVAGGPMWPDWRDASINEIARPDTFSNVQGGHGFVGGIYSDTIRIPIRPRQ